jgi:hypothetical protein
MDSHISLAISSYMKFSSMTDIPLLVQNSNLQVVRFEEARKEWKITKLLTIRRKIMTMIMHNKICKLETNQLPAESVD